MSKSINVALIGNPNTGKSSVFNDLTGLNQKVGNYPGITVEKKEGLCNLERGFKAHILDLPGTYSLNASSLDESVVIELLLNKNDKDFPDVVGVAHCFSSTEDTATKLIELGYYISFSGNITFKNSHLPEFVGKLPLDRILVETDCPYLSPVPFRGKPNEPGRARFVAEKISEIFKLPFEIIAAETTKNASKLFNL